MKEFIKLLDTSNEFYANNMNLSMAYIQLNTLGKRCNEFVSFLRSAKNEDALQNSIDSLVLTDETFVVLGLNIADNVSKQVDFFTKNKVGDNMLRLKKEMGVASDYINYLTNTVGKMRFQLSYLTKAKKDIADMISSFDLIEKEFNGVIKESKKGQLYGENARKYIASELGGRIDGHKAIKETLVEASQNVDRLLATYNTLISSMAMEIEITRDLASLESDKKQNDRQQ